MSSDTSRDFPRGAPRDGPTADPGRPVTVPLWNAVDSSRRSRASRGTRRRDVRAIERVTPSSRSDATGVSDTSGDMSGAIVRPGQMVGDAFNPDLSH